MTTKLYDLPATYDIAFSWDNSAELDFFRSVFQSEVPFPVENVLEPACGTGRFLTTLSSHGYRVTGYDINPNMVNYARRAVSSSGLDDRAKVIQADMVSAEFDEVFDSAFNAINSFCYLLSDADVVAHLETTASALREGGVYIVHMNFAQAGDIPGGEPWTMEREGTRVETSWEILEEDRDARLSHEMATFQVETGETTERFEERHTLRLWLYQDFLELLTKSGLFSLISIFGEDFKELEDGQTPSGELGNVYLVLQRT